jgi:hypothetical protein
MVARSGVRAIVNDKPAPPNRGRPLENKPRVSLSNITVPTPLRDRLLAIAAGHNLNHGGLPSAPKAVAWLVDQHEAATQSPLK